MTDTDIKKLQRQIDELNRLIKLQSKMIRLLTRLTRKLVAASVPAQPEEAPHEQ